MIENRLTELRDQRVNVGGVVLVVASCVACEIGGDFDNFHGYTRVNEGVMTIWPCAPRVVGVIGTQSMQEPPVSAVQMPA